MTLEAVEKRKQKGADFARNVLKNDDLADSLEDEDPFDYAERKHLKISNSGRRKTTMANGNGGADYDFTGWTKDDCLDTLTQVAQIADEAFDPLSSREDAMQALSDILDTLSGEDSSDDDADGDDADADGPDYGQD